jgi:Fe-S cluster assembly protein SufD
MVQPRGNCGENSCANYRTSPKPKPRVNKFCYRDFRSKNAIVDYYKIQNDNLDANLIDNTYVSQKQESHVSVHTFSFENITKTTDFYLPLCGD